VFLIQDVYSLSDPTVRLSHTTTAAIGESMFSRFVLPFEAISFLLLAALIGAVVLALAAWLRITALEWAVLVLTMALVLALEALNTAIELTVTLASPQRHPLAKAAKDVAAAMVLIAAIASVIVGLVILGPRLF